MTDQKLDKGFREFLSMDTTRASAALLVPEGADDDDRLLMLNLLHSAFVHGAQAGANLTLGEIDTMFKKWGEIDDRRLRRD